MSREAFGSKRITNADIYFMLGEMTEAIKTLSNRVESDHKRFEKIEKQLNKYDRLIAYGTGVIAVVSTAGGYVIHRVLG